MKNFDNVETIDKNRHARLRVKPNQDFVHARELNLAAITLSELSACTGNFPVVFVEHPETKVMRPVAMFGLRPGENVYYAQEGWDSTYVPLMIQRYPFVIGFDDRNEDSNTLTICVDKTSPFLSEEEGIALFKENGDDTDFLVSRRQLLGELFEGERFTERFTQKMIELNLLSPFELILQPENGELRKVTGMYTIRERKLRELTPAQLEELHKLDFLPACYIIIASVFQLHQLMKLRNRKGNELILNYRIELDPQPQQAAQVPAQQPAQ